MRLFHSFFVSVPVFCFLGVCGDFEAPANAKEFPSSSQAIALEPVVVTASGVEEPLEAVSVSVEVITEKDMRERQAERVDEALRGISGIKINSYGGADPWAWVEGEVRERKRKGGGPCG